MLTTNGVITGMQKTVYFQRTLNHILQILETTQGTISQKVQHTLILKRTRDFVKASMCTILLDC